MAFNVEAIMGNVELVFTCLPPYNAMPLPPIINYTFSIFHYNPGYKYIIISICLNQSSALWSFK